MRYQTHIMTATLLLTISIRDINLFQYIDSGLFEQEKDHQSLQQHFMQTNQLLVQISLFNIMLRHNYHDTVFDNLMC